MDVNINDLTDIYVLWHENHPPERGATIRGVFADVESANYMRRQLLENSLGGEFYISRQPIIFVEGLGLPPA